MGGLDVELELSEHDVRRFADDGFLVCERIVDPGTVGALVECYEELFAGRG